MMTKFINKTLVLSVCGLASIGFTKSVAKENVNLNGQHKVVIGQGQQKTTAAACKPAQATIDLDINNVRARLMTGGDMWWNQGIDQAAYEVPINSGKNSLFAGSLWVGGYDPQGQLKVAAQTYRQNGNDYWPGPLSDDGKNDISTETCADWDKFWKVSAADIATFREMVAQGNTSWKNDPTYENIVQWPATGNSYATSAKGTPLTMLSSTTRSYAPFWDVSGPNGTPDGIYQPDYGDYPKILGDQYIWWVFNDKGNVKGETQSASIGLEIQASAFGFARKDALNNATFYRYTMINRGTQPLDSAYVATWSDADLGYAFDDYIGCDTTRGLGILYNGNSIDGSGQPNSYGSEVPMVAVDFFEGPKKYFTDPVTGKDTFVKLKMGGFYFFNNDFTNIGNPSSLAHYYGYMTGTTRGGQRFTNGSCTGYGAGAVTKYVFYGNPDVSTEWSECEMCHNKPDDRRFVHSAGPFRLDAGAANDITIGAVWTPNVGGCPGTSFAKIREADDLAQDLFDRGFIPTKGPDAPRMVFRELDRKLAVYLVNDPSSNNYQEKFGSSDSAKYRTTTPKSAKFSDSLYKFEGYRIFQLKNSEVSISDIYNTDGSVNTDVAREVSNANSDIQNGVKSIYNWYKTDLGNGNDTNYLSQLKVTGKDSGIKHSFVLETDQFATGSDNKFVNYKTYYFTAVAYAYNDFAATRSSTGAVVPSFSGLYKDYAIQQDVPYLESTSGAIYSVMPNPAGGDMGTYLQANFGDGVMVRRIEGQGNGGNNISMTSSSEDTALMAPDYRVKYPLYQLSAGPVAIKVVDPVKVPGGDWELYIYGTLPLTDVTRGIMAATGSWKLVHNNNGVSETVYSERNLTTLNEQIIEKYGLSVSAVQVARPSDDQTSGSMNGYISSSISYADPKVAWLSGIKDEEGVSSANWIRAGRYVYTVPTGQTLVCDYSDYTKNVDSNQVYEGLFANSQLLKGSWAPYTLGYSAVNGKCEFGVGAANDANRPTSMRALAGVDLVFTSDKSKWSKCVVMEMQDEPILAKHNVKKFRPRSHASWDKDVDANGNPVYVTNGDTGKSWFPGYAINQETGERLNIAFGEDSWLGNYGGDDMIWNPNSIQLDPTTQGLINGGKHYIYILNTKYDEGKNMFDNLNGFRFDNIFKDSIMWVGLPLLNAGYRYKSAGDGFIPTETRLKFRVTKPYARYIPDADTVNHPLKNSGLPYYTFSTNNLVALAKGSDNPYTSDSLLKRINVVPNPYYGRAAESGYEESRLETFVKIINLPQKATVTIYTLDGTLVRKITKDDNTPQIEWDMKNFRNLPVASGMYLIHVNAEGIGETVLKWFGGMRPIDITNY